MMRALRMCYVMIDYEMTTSSSFNGDHRSGTASIHDRKKDL